MDLMREIDLQLGRPCKQQIGVALIYGLVRGVVQQFMQDQMATLMQSQLGRTAEPVEIPIVPMQIARHKHTTGRRQVDQIAVSKRIAPIFPRTSLKRCDYLFGRHNTLRASRKFLSFRVLDSPHRLWYCQALYWRKLEA